MCHSQQPEQYGWRSLSLGKNPVCLGLISDWSEGWGREESKCEPKTTKHFEFVDDDLQELLKELCTKEHRYEHQMGSEEPPSMERHKKVQITLSQRTYWKLSSCDNAASAELRCHIHLLDTYINKLPPSVGNEKGAFYL